MQLVFAAGQSNVSKTSTAVFKQSHYVYASETVTPKQVIAAYNNDDKGQYYKIKIIMPDDSIIEKSFGMISQIVYTPMLYAEFNPLGADMSIMFTDNSKLILFV